MCASVETTARVREQRLLVVMNENTIAAVHDARTRQRYITKGETNHAYLQKSDCSQVLKFARSTAHAGHASATAHTTAARNSMVAIKCACAQGRSKRSDRRCYLLLSPSSLGRHKSSPPLAVRSQCLTNSYTLLLLRCACSRPEKIKKAAGSSAGRSDRTQARPPRKPHQTTGGK